MIDHLIFIGSITLLVVFFSIDMIYADGNNDTYWFQRSGSVVVVLAAWLEYRQIKPFFDVLKLKDKAANAGNKYFGLWAEDTVRNFFSGIALFLAIAGTIVWGYGDLLFK